MFCKEKVGENPLHLAVISNNIESVKILGQNPELVIEQNSFGYSPIELAHFLQRGEILNILSPESHKNIKIVLPDTDKVASISPQEFERIFKIRYLNSLHFDDYATFKHLLNNSRFLRCFIAPFCKETVTEASKLGRELQIELTIGYTIDTIIRWIDNTMGYGLFTESALEANTFIGEYTGLIRKINRLASDTNAYCFHYPNRWWSFNYYVIDALHEGNALRFINHSEIPNIKPVCVIDRGLVHIAMMTNRKIEKGEQLTFNYGKDYWKRRLK